MPEISKQKETISNSDLNITQLNTKQILTQEEKTNDDIM